MRVQVRQAAEDDLDGIWSYTYDTWGERQADAYYGELVHTIRTLEARLALARPVPGRESMQKLLYRRHLIVFEAEDALLVVVRILHQSMDIDRHL